MSLYTPTQLADQQSKRTVFSALEGTVSFYAESSYALGKTRLQMPLLASHLFINSLTVNDIRNFHPYVQPFGSKTKSLTALESVESKLNLQTMLVETGDNTAWFAPNHPPLICFIDYIAETVANSRQSGDIYDANGFLHQTIVLRNCRCNGASITGADTAMVGWTIEFVCGELTYLPITTMDLP